MGWIRYIIVALLAYLLGAIPMGYLVVKAAKGLDIRQVGSGRIGGSNVLRTAGLLAAVASMVGDFFKGYGAVLLARALIGDDPVVTALAGLLAIAGHNWSVFLGFAGGVGTITTFGAAMALVPQAAWIATGIGAVVMLATRYTSLGSITFSLVLILASLGGALMGVWPGATMIFAAGSACMSIWELRPNIDRLRRGCERKLGQMVRPGHSDVANLDQ
jgi:glycerol-3-phosphate acyltransferase PlsY